MGRKNSSNVHVTIIAKSAEVWGKGAQTPKRNNQTRQKRQNKLILIRLFSQIWKEGNGFQKTKLCWADKHSGREPRHGENRHTARCLNRTNHWKKLKTIFRGDIRAEKRHPHWGVGHVKNFPGTTASKGDKSLDKSDKNRKSTKKNPTT